MRLLKLIPAILLSLTAPMLLPVSAQTPVFGGSCTLLHVGEPSDTLYGRLNGLLRTEELAEMQISFQSIKPTSEGYAEIIRTRGVSRDSLWALTVREGGKDRCLIQGGKLPTIEDIQNALDRAGIKSAVRALRDFLKKYPDHLDARRDLASRLRSIAEARTQQVLKLDQDLAAKNDISQQIARSLTTKILIDTSALEDKILEPEQDIVIWGPYAQELHTLFTNGDWQLGNFFGAFGRWEPIDVCSPTMVQLYRRHLPKVEAFLETFPSDQGTWRLYGWMVSMTKQGNTMALLDRITPSPDITWPTPEVLNLVISEEASKENWNFVAETLLEMWPRNRMTVIVQFRLTDNEDRAVNPVIKGFRDLSWQEIVNPLLGSLIKTKRIEDAEAVILGLVKNTSNKDIQRMAADLAQSLGRGDLQSKWLELEIIEKAGLTNADLEFYLPVKPPMPSLTVLGAEEASNQQIAAMLRQGPLLDWSVTHLRLTPQLTDFLRQRERWPENETHWALFYGNKIIADGPGLPTEDALILELESSGIQTRTHILRRFTREHPDHYEAKERLLRELRRISEQKVRELFGTNAGVNIDRYLTDEEDLDIWSGYAALYRQALPYFLEQGRGGDLSYALAFSSNYFIHSPTMKNISRSFMSQVEASIKRHPSDSFLWHVWVALFDLNENRDFWNFWETIEFGPTQNMDFLPPTLPWQVLLDRCVARSNWREIVTIQEPFWELMQQDPGIRLWHWIDRNLQPLLEAYLRLEKTREANEFIRIWSQSAQWVQVKPLAVALAKKCGKEDLAEQWQKL